jgi:hypothetical protein
MKPFTSKRGSIRVHLDAQERAILEQLPVYLGDVGDAAVDPAGARLNPAVYLDDPAAQAEYEQLMEDELVTVRDHDRGLFLETLDGSDRLDLEEAAVWMRVIGDARLAIAARSGVVHGGDDWEDRARREPDLALVAWLGFLQGALVDAVRGAGSDDVEEDP